MRRLVIATLSSLALLAIVLGLVVGDLPDPVATHFAPTGVADGFSSHEALWAITLGIPAVLAMLLGTVTATTARHAPVGLGWINGLPVAIVWFVGTLMIATVVPQRGLADAAGFTLPALAVPLSVVVGVAVTALAGRLVPPPDTPTTTAPAVGDVPRHDLPAGTALFTTDTPGSTVTTIVGGLLVVTGVLFGVFTTWWIGLLVAAVAVPVIGASRFTVTVGPEAVRIAGAVVAWPAIEIPTTTITAARTDVIRPLEFGGIGIRIQPGLKTTGIVTSRGPALAIDRTDGSTVKVSLDDPARAAGVVNSLLDRRGVESSGRR